MGGCDRQRAYSLQLGNIWHSGVFLTGPFLFIYLFIYSFNCLSVCLVSPRRLRGREEKRRRRGGGKRERGVILFYCGYHNINSGYSLLL